MKEKINDQTYNKMDIEPDKSRPRLLWQDHFQLFKYIKCRLFGGWFIYKKPRHIKDKRGTEYFHQKIGPIWGIIYLNLKARLKKDLSDDSY